MKIQEKHDTLSESNRLQLAKLTTDTQLPLVNIPIQEVGIREALTELDTKHWTNQTRSKPGKGGKRWKRSAGKENILTGHARMEKEVPNASNKWQWQLID